MIFVVRRLEEQARKRDTPLCMCFIDLTKTYDLFDRVRPRVLAVVRHFRDGMRACSDMSDVEQGLLQRVCARVIAVQHVFHGGTFCTVQLLAADKRFIADTARKASGSGSEGGPYDVGSAVR